MSLPQAALPPAVMPDDRPWRSTITGRVDVTTLRRAGQRRAVRTYLPPDYETSGVTYPVLYMFDGANLFDRATTAYGTEWEIDETLEQMWSDGLTSGLVVVGIDAPTGPGERFAEYTAWDWTYPGGPPVSATGALTADFLVHTVKPHIEAEYRVATDRADVLLGGSSLGGYMTLFVGARHADQFGTLLSFSPAALQDPMAGDRLLVFIEAAESLSTSRVYLDMGDSEELSYVSSPAVLVARLQEIRDSVARCHPQELVCKLVGGADHSEAAWGARFAQVITWALAGR